MTSSRLDVQQVKSMARGRWLDVFHAITPNLDLAIENCGKHVPCPVQGGKDGFRLFKDAAQTGGGVSNKSGMFSDGFAVLSFVMDRPFKDVLNMVAESLGIDGNTITQTKPIHAPVMQDHIDPMEEKQRKSKLNRYWRQTSKIQPNDRVVRYLRSRGIKGDWILDCSTIKYHPNSWFFDKNGNQQSAPAMALKFYDSNGTPCNIHKTLLSSKEDGKLEVDQPKLMMKPACKMRGGAVRLGSPEMIEQCDGVLHISEGFENAATIRDVFDQPSWAALNWALLQGFIPPEEVKTLVIWADNDPLDDKGHNAGLDAAKRLIERMGSEFPHIKTVLKVPPQKKVDWNDYYCQGKMEHFSNLESNCHQVDAKGE